MQIQNIKSWNLHLYLACENMLSHWIFKLPIKVAEEESKHKIPRVWGTDSEKDIYF